MTYLSESLRQVEADKGSIPNSSGGSKAEEGAILCVSLGGVSRYRKFKCPEIFPENRVVPRAKPSLDELHHPEAA